MELKELNQQPSLEINPKLNKKFVHFEELIIELKGKELPDGIIESINNYIENINSAPITELKKQIRISQYAVLKLLEKELKLVAVNYYRNLWMALGMSMFGVPFGVVIGMSLDNMAFLGTGIPIGMIIGMVMGSQMDAKAKKEGRQLKLECK